MLRFISLFAGIGGLDLGLERAGMQCVAQVEIDDYAQRVLTKHWPNVPKFRDVRSVGRHNLPAADLICGGFPCQDISNAGKRAGINGERSGLWSEFHRIICELRPRYVLVENVSALLGRGLGRVLGDLAESGYDTEWECLPAAAFGAPHRRDRLFLVAYAACGGFIRQSEGDKDARMGLAGSGQGQPRTDANWTMADAECLGCNQVVKPVFSRAKVKRPTDTAKHGGLSAGRGWWATEPDVGRVADGVPRRVDRLRGLGNAVVPQVAEFIGRQIVAHATAQEAIS